MSWSTGTNTIQEGGEPKALSLQMLEVSKQGGGTEYFVRKSDVTLGTKSVNKNGTYTAASDGKYGFSQFSVNVAGGNGSADSHGKPTGDIDPGGIGSAIEGIDEDGNEQIIGVDEGGNLVKTPLPSSIVLVVEPTKMDYNDGETIDLTGAIVLAKNADGTVWSDLTHLDGQVPVIELRPDPATADASAVSDETWTDGDGVNAMLITMLDDGIGDKPTGIGRNYTPNYDMTLGCGGAGATFYATQYDGQGFLYQKSGNVGQINGFNVATRAFRAGTSGFSALGRWVNLVLPGEYLPESTKDPRNSTGELTPAGGTQTITLKWARPGDGKVLTTTMEINVGAHTTQSSRGTSGSGGGGTF